MTQPVPQYTVGVDVSRNTLDSYELATGHSSVIAKDIGPIEQWRDRWSGVLRLAMEPTSTYHRVAATRTGNPATWPSANAA